MPPVGATKKSIWMHGDRVPTRFRSASKNCAVSGTCSSHKSAIAKKGLVLGTCAAMPEGREG